MEVWYDCGARELVWPNLGLACCFLYSSSLNLFFSSSILLFYCLISCFDLPCLISTFQVIPLASLLPSRSASLPLEGSVSLFISLFPGFQSLGFLTPLFFYPLLGHPLLIFRFRIPLLMRDNVDSTTHDGLWFFYDFTFPRLIRSS